MSRKTKKAAHSTLTPVAVHGEMVVFQRTPWPQEGCKQWAVGSLKGMGVLKEFDDCGSAEDWAKKAAAACQTGVEIFSESGEEMKCGGCNWTHTTFYSTEPITVDDKNTDEPRSSGLCAECFLESVMQQGARLVLNRT